MQERVSITHVTIGGELAEAGLKPGSVVYLAWDAETRRLMVVQWNRTRWHCSCGRPCCEHRLAANSYAYARSQQKAVQE